MTWHVVIVVVLVAVVAPADAPPGPSAAPAAAEKASPAAPKDGPSGQDTAPGKDSPEAKAKDGADKGKGPGAESPDQEAEEAPTVVDWRKIVDDILNSGAMGEMLRGGFFMWPILVLGIMAAGVILERWRSLKMVATDTVVLRGEVMDLLQADQVEEALKKCDAQQGPVPAVLAVGLRKYLVLRRLNYDAGQINDQVVRAMDDYGVHIVAALERHLPILATVSSAAPMLGFLGTVQGMVISFREIVERMGETNIVEAAARGINIALLTTVFGLIVGIPAFIAYNYYTSVINRYVLQVEESATELIETVTLKMALEPNDAAPATSAPAQHGLDATK
jgi:biopolymer transport protein ExbB